MIFVCSCYSRLDKQAAHALELKCHDYRVEIDADTQEDAARIFKQRYLASLDLSDAPVDVFIAPKTE